MTHTPLYHKVVELETFPEEMLTTLHDPETGNDTEVAYRLAWARTYLKKDGLLENSVRGIWSLTAKAKETKQVEPQEVVKYVKALSKTTGADKPSDASPTGTFTPAALKEATRDGAPPIDLVDGTELADKLKDLGLGVVKETVEVIKVDENWFASV